MALNSFGNCFNIVPFFGKDNVVVTHHLITPFMLKAHITLRTLRYHVRWCSVVFMALPLLIFLLGWLTVPLALGTAGLLCAGVMGWIRSDWSQSPQQAQESETLSLGILFATLLPVFAITLISGVGGFGPQTWDWIKHNAILHDLITQPWPVAYATDKDSAALVYYIAYYLPAAVIGKITSWKIANLALVAMTLVGTSLAVLWLVILCRGKALLAMIVFVVFSGMDMLGEIFIKASQWDLATLIHEQHLEWWSTYWQYSSNVSLLYYAPHQAIAGWILVALVVDAMQAKDRPLPIMMVLAISALWSPFVAMGLMPFLLVYLAVPKQSIHTRLRLQLSIANVAGMILIGLFFLYYVSRFESVTLPDLYMAGVLDSNRGAFRFLPVQLPFQEFFFHYVLFIGCEFGVLWLLLIFACRQTQTGSWLSGSLFAAGMTLLVLPWFHYGWYNDLVMRTSIPALFILQIAVVQTLKSRETLILRILMILVLGLGALHSANLLRMNVTWIAKTGQMITLRSEQKVQNLFLAHLFDPYFGRLVPQYLGSINSLFFTKLTDDLHMQNVETPNPRRRVDERDLKE